MIHFIFYTPDACTSNDCMLPVRAAIMRKMWRVNRNANLRRIVSEFMIFILLPKLKTLSNKIVTIFLNLQISSIGNHRIDIFVEFHN